MSVKALVRIAEEYLRKFPMPSSVQIMKGMLKLTYIYTAPATNSKSKKEIYYPVQDLKAAATLQSGTPILNFDEKTNKLEYNNEFDSILTDEVHEKVLQDPVFGSAKLNKNKDKWIYAAKKKVPKTKSYFLGGSGKSVYAPDLGETYDDISQVGIYIWDLKLKKVIPIDIKFQNEQMKHVFAYPVFANDEGTKFICHGYKKLQFGHGVVSCFNRAVDIFEVSIQNLGVENMKVSCKRLVKKHETNIFATISPCYNYILYFGSTDFVHSHYQDLIILKRRTEGDNNNLDQGYDKEWKQLHRKKQAFVGYYTTIKTQIFIQNNQPHAYFQLVQNSQQRIKCINMQTGEITIASQNKTGQSYSIVKFDKEQELVAGVVNTHNYNSFFYMKAGENKQYIIPPLNQEEFKIQQLKDPIPGYLLSSQKPDDEFKKEKKPLLVLVHGGPHGHGDPALTLFKYMLLKCGYMILIPNFSGSSGFGQQFLKGALGNIGKKDAEEIIQLIQNVCKSKENIDKERVHVYGGSYGGYMAAIMGSRYPQYFKSAVILNGVLNIIGNFWFSDIPQWSSAQTIKEAKYHNLTVEDYIKMYEQSPTSQSMKIPTLQFLGAKDRRVPYRQGLLFDAMTRKVGTPIKTFVYENAGHSLADSVQTSIDVVLKSMQFLQEIPFQQIKEEKVKEVKEEKEKPSQKMQEKQRKFSEQEIEK